MDHTNSNVIDVTYRLERRGPAPMGSDGWYFSQEGKLYRLRDIVVAGIESGRWTAEDVRIVMITREVVASPEISEAIAKLIAAAPELLDALRDVVDFGLVQINGRHRDRSRDAFERARDLLRRLESRGGE